MRIASVLMILLVVGCGGSNESELAIQIASLQKRVETLEARIHDEKAANPLLTATQLTLVDAKGKPSVVIDGENSTIDLIRFGEGRGPGFSSLHLEANDDEGFLSINRYGTQRAGIYCSDLMARSTLHDQVGGIRCETLFQQETEMSRIALSSKHREPRFVAAHIHGDEDSEETVKNSASVFLFNKEGKPKLIATDK